jgi:excisionase family DNA binding protein
MTTVIKMQTLQPLTYTVEQAAKLLGIGRKQGYQAVGKKEIPSLRIGGRILVPRAALEQMLIAPSTKKETD